MQYRITHRTAYKGDEPVSVGHNQAWLRPRTLPYQQCESYRLDITPAPSMLTWQTDYFGNQVAVFSFNQGYESLEVVAVSEVSVLPHIRAEDALADGTRWEAVVDALANPQDAATVAAVEFVQHSPRVDTFDALRDYGRESFLPNRPFAESLLDLTARINKQFRYQPHSTNVATPVRDVFAQRSGVCQDFAHLQIGILRSLGLAARYVSGYLRTYPAPGQPRLVGADSSHAWLSVYAGPLGWIDIDPTNDLIPHSEHITLAWGRDYSDVTPLKGVFIGGGNYGLQVSVDVAPM